ncbi:MAG: alpha/beta hydrolase [Bryobacterales bacterium]|nr:alpha/beta hydrolase [Bryobacterales bacterium]
MPKILIRGIETHYQTRGEGADVVLIHGLTSSLAAWYNGTLPSLVAAGFRVTVYDLRGHGLSDLTPNGYSSFDLAEDLKAILDSLGIDRVLLAGHSFGGAIAMHFALLNPARARGVTLLDSGMACLRYLRVIKEWKGWDQPGMKEEGFTPEWFEAVDNRQDMSDYLRKTLSVPRIRGFKRGQGGYSPRLQKLIEHTRVGYEFRELAGLTEDRLREIQTPVLALYGEISPNQKMAPYLGEIMQNCSPVNLKGLGHFAALHDPKPILERMTPFFQDPDGYVQKWKSAQRTGILDPPLQTSTSPLT